MGKIYKDQTKLTFTINLSDDITGYSAVYLKYTKPSGTSGQFTATVSDAATGVLTYTVSNGDIDEAGRWTFWGYVDFADGTAIAGEADTLIIYNQGQ